MYIGEINRFKKGDRVKLVNRGPQGSDALGAEFGAEAIVEGYEKNYHSGGPKEWLRVRWDDPRSREQSNGGYYESMFEPALEREFADGDGKEPKKAHSLTTQQLASLTRYVVKSEGPGNKIAAVKELRALTGLGLRDAQRMVDAATQEPADPVLEYIERHVVE